MRSARDRSAAAASRPAPPAWRRRAELIGLVAALALAAAVRLAPSPKFFANGAVLLGEDGDTYYHALRAERIARSWPAVPWFDPAMNFPYGAEIPWPPLFDHLVATAALMTGPATSLHVASTAAVVPVVLGLVAVLVTFLVASALTGTGWPAALLVAVLPAAARLGYVGRADHHVVESVLSTLGVLLLTQGLVARSWARALWLGLVLALAFWNWPGSALYLVMLGACVAALHLALPGESAAAGRAAELVAVAAAACAVLLGVSIATVGPPAALWSTRLAPISGLAVLLAALAAAAAAGVAAARRWSPAAPAAARALHLVLAAAPAALVGLASEAAREGILHGATAFRAANPWYQSISEFWPLLFSARSPWTQELAGAAYAYGLTPVALLGAGVLIRRRWRSEPDARPRLVVLATWTALTLGLALVRRRFEAYAAVPLAVCAGWCAAELGEWLSRRFAPARRYAPAWVAIASLLLALPGLPAALSGDVGNLPGGAEDKLPLLSWLSRAPSRPGREAVLSFWAHGHEIQWLTRRPVVSTPFGTDIDARSLRGEATFVAAREPAVARRLVDERRVGYVLLQNPVNEVASIGPFAPAYVPVVVEGLGVRTGTRWDLYEEFFDLVVSRLFFFDGGSRLGAPPLTDYRLVAESPGSVDVAGIRSQRFKLFGVVEGAILRASGLPPGGLFRCATRVTTNVGRVFEWSSTGAADPTGTGDCRVPYASGANGLVVAEPYVVTGPAGRARVSVSEEAVLTGATVPLAISR